jgi:hypothetical protein
MSEMIETMPVIDVSTSISSMAEPTPELQWQPRGSDTAFPNCRLVLQQRWRITEYRGGSSIAVRYEWRDVPTSTE